MLIILLLQPLEVAVVEFEPLFGPRAASDGGPLCHSLVCVLCLVFAYDQLPTSKKWQLIEQNQAWLVALCTTNSRPDSVLLMM